MDDQQINDLAHKRADSIAPLPKQDAFQAGLIGAAIAGIVVAVFSGFARLNSDSFAGSIGLTVILGFLVPWGYLKYVESLHYKEWAKQYTALKEQHAQKP